MLRYAWRTAPLAIVLLSACAGNGEGLDASGRPLTTGPEPLVAELKSIQDNVFTPICTACHVGAAAPLGFRLDASSTFAMLVNTPSVEVPSMLRVAPGNPDASYLIQKLEGHAAVGGQMPLGQPPLAQATIDVIRQWITDGAQASASATSLAGPVRMRAITPLPGESLSRPPADIVVAADGELDTSSIDSSTVLLVRSGGDGSPGDAKDAAKDAVIADVRVTVRSLNPTVLAFSRAGEQWAAGRYQLTIAGRERSVVTDRNGTAIDGAASGLAGSDFVLEFTVEASP